MQKINLRELYPDVYKTDVFVDVAEEVVAAIRGQEQDDAAYDDFQGISRRGKRHPNEQNVRDQRKVRLPASEEELH